MGFRPLQRIARWKRPTPDLPIPAVLRSQVFSTSQRLIPPPNVPALFHADSTRGVLDPSELSPPRDQVPLTVSLPVLTLPSCSLPTVASGCCHEAARLHGFNPSRSPFIHQTVLPVWRSRYSPGFHPLQGVPPLRLEGCLHILLLLRTSGRTFPEGNSLALYLRVSKNEEVDLSRERDCRPSWG
jgi:hypothetical protein